MDYSRIGTLAATICLFACETPGVIDVNLAPPAPGTGFQLTVPTFEIAPGAEVQACHFFAVPGNPGETVWINRYHIAQTTGSHHMNIFRVKTVKKLSGTPGGPPVVNGECFVSSNWSDWPLVVNTQQEGQTDWTLPADVGARFEAGEVLMLQTHYVNATTQRTPGTGKVFANFHQIAAAPKHEMATLFATNQNIRVCPGDRNRTFAKTCTFPSAGVNVIAANGHFHSRGSLFTMNAVDAAGQDGAKFYESVAWDDPPMLRDFSVPLPAGGGVKWNCSFSAPADSCGNPADNCCFNFGGMVESQEHCNAFVYYWPKTVDVNCF